MKTLNTYIILWLIIQLCIVLFTMSSTEDDITILFWFTLPFLILNCIAVGLILLGKPKTGGILFLIGSAIFVPIGLIGALGARKILDKIKEDNFKKTL